jgi:hypothetical protein
LRLRGEEDEKRREERKEERIGRGKMEKEG